MAETDIDRGLDFPSRPASRPVMFEIMKSGKRKSRNLKCKIIDCFHRTIFISVSGKKLIRKKSNKDKQNLEKWENLDLGRVYRPHWVGVYL